MSANLDEERKENEDKPDPLFEAIRKSDIQAIDELLKDEATLRKFLGDPITYFKVIGMLGNITVLKHFFTLKEIREIISKEGIIKKVKNEIEYGKDAYSPDAIVIAI